jgi:hypothetical protein
MLSSKALSIQTSKKELFVSTRRHLDESPIKKVLTIGRKKSMKVLITCKTSDSLYYQLWVRDALRGESNCRPDCDKYSVRLNIQDRIVYRVEQEECVAILVRAETHCDE